MQFSTDSLKNNPEERKSRLLVVDDELHIRTALVKAFTLVGYEVDEAASGQEALAMLNAGSYDLMILDIVLPDLAGIDVLQWANQIQADVSIIILTGNATLESAIAAIKSDAVDYLLKPASIHEIIDAVSHALQKRVASAQKEFLVEMLGNTGELPNASERPPALSPPSPTNHDRFVVVSSWCLDRSRCEVIINEEPKRQVDLSKGETAVLYYLMQNVDQTVSWEQLVWLAWGYKADPYEAKSIIRPYIFRLRNKLEKNPQEPHLICTVRKYGYKLVSTND